MLVTVKKKGRWIISPKMNGKSSKSKSLLTIMPEISWKMGFILVGDDPTNPHIRIPKIRTKVLIFLTEEKFVCKNVKHNYMNGKVLM